MYTDKDFKTKKELKEALNRGVTVRVFQPNDLFGNTEKVSLGNHTVYLEGPHYPKPHSWYAEAKVVDGVVTKVR